MQLIEFSLLNSICFFAIKILPTRSVRLLQLVRGLFDAADPRWSQQKRAHHVPSSKLHFTNIMQWMA